MIYPKQFLFFIIGLLVVTTPHHQVSAYIEQTAGGSLIAEVTPQTTKPEETITIHLTGYGFDLNKSQIAWLINNKPQSEGVGIKNFSFTTGPIGSITSLNIIVRANDGRTIIKNLVFRPADFDLLFEANTKVPLFYQGAPLPTKGSPVKIVAIPQVIVNNKDLTLNDLTFNWLVNGLDMGNQSGVGKNNLNFLLSANKTSDLIELRMVSKKWGINVTKQLNITATEPEVWLYQNEPLIGPRYEKSLLGNIPINSDLLTIRAEPFYFAPNSQLTYSWQLNDKIVPSGNKQELNIETTSNSSSSSTISIRVSDLKNNLLQAINTFKISLNGQF